MFRGRKLVIATKHHKERVLAPMLEAALGVTCCVAEHLDTDLLGTFSGEVERLDDPLATAREKCRRAMAATGCDLGIASEGSFGPHPAIFFAGCDDELLLFVDQKNNLEITARELSLDTNFNGQSVRTEAELYAFAHQAHFPSHGLILRASKTDHTHTVKGITDWNLLVTTFQQLMASANAAYVETDMRALFNPTRMRVIETTATKLIATIQHLCPTCATPGFAVARVNRGLPCALCGWPTQAPLSYTYICQRCAFTEDVALPDAQTTQDPRFCARCNP
jgi:hypothetical protein